MCCKPARYLIASGKGLLFLRAVVDRRLQSPQRNLPHLDGSVQIAGDLLQGLADAARSSSFRLSTRRVGQQAVGVDRHAADRLLDDVAADRFVRGRREHHDRRKATVNATNIATDTLAAKAR